MLLFVLLAKLLKISRNCIEFIFWCRIAAIPPSTELNQSIRKGKPYITLNGLHAGQATANIVAFLISFTGSDLISGSIIDVNRSPGVPSLDTPAAVGRQLTLSNSASVTLLDTMLALASSSTSRVDLVCKGIKDGLPRGWFFDRSSGTFLSDRQTETFTPAALRALAAPGSEQTYTVVPRGCGRRIGIDRDADGYLDRDEMDFGSDPANPLSPATNSPPRLGVLTVSTNGITLTWSALSGRTYRLQYKNTLTDSLWLDVAGDVVAVTNFPSKPDPAPVTNNSRFYRIIALP